jgi:Dullard-like phosphatase family protein
MKFYENFNTYNERNTKYYENEINMNNMSFYYDNREYLKKEEFINIEDLLILEEKFCDVLKSVKSKHNTPNECFELLNSYQQSSVYNNFENYFNSIESKNIVHSSIMYLIYDVIICYHFSFDVSFFDTCYKYLENILEINHKTFLLLCNIISNKISSSSNDNIWVDKLRQMLKENLNHIELNNKEYISFLMDHKNINFKNPTSSNLLEIKFYIIKIEKYLQLFLNTISNANTLKAEFYSLFENLLSITVDKLLHFFKSKIIRVINQNASVAGIESITDDIDNNKVEVPYLKNKCPKKFCLVLDLDETLISFKLEPGDENKGTIRFRPYLDSFLQKVKEKYEIIVFTSGTKDYADPLEDAIEQEENYFDARLYRHHTVAYGKDIVKDISRIGRPLDKICIVENMPQNFRLQKENGILIKSFYGEDIYDTALFSLGDILIKIANEFNDIRKGIAKYKNEILNKVTSNLSKMK